VISDVLPFSRLCYEERKEITYRRRIKVPAMLVATIRKC
jgi:hypothetical protein